MLRSRKLLILLLALSLTAVLVHFSGGIVSTGPGKEESAIVISLGEDLTEAQKEEVLNYFQDWQKGRTTRYITVSNSEERRYLQGLIDEKLIGTRAISSAYCELLEKDRGIEVETHKITAITPFMYANAATTAGVEDARIIVAAPFEVSGTAALTGITKAFETAKGEKLNESAKETAQQEMADTKELGDKIGTDKAEKIIYEVKRQVIEKNTSDPEEIRKIIIDVSGKFNVTLAEEDVDKIVALMQRLSSLNISIDQVSEQLKTLERNIGEIESTGREVVGFMQQLVNMLKEIINSIRSLIQ
ncbi:MAG: DUF1002 domain-containing protein [Syntrophomonadaceae bacterium]|nr:DUF1002 domain-containing protein [Syntrophomonadaceae bacterium]MDD3899380.1 DUF1002 domain-containing protein [Syntrophomonadaceae bacterium]